MNDFSTVFDNTNTTAMKLTTKWVLSCGPRSESRINFTQHLNIKILNHLKEESWIAAVDYVYSQGMNIFSFVGFGETKIISYIQRFW